MMRTSYLVLHGLFFGALVSACGDDGGGITTAGTESGGSTSSTTGDPTTNSTDPTSGDPTSSPECVPGTSIACTCTNGDPGAQVCQPDGQQFGECVCEGGGSNSNSESNTNATIDPETTTGVSGSTTDVATTDAGTTTTGEETAGSTTLDTLGSTTLGESGDVDCEDPGTEPNEDETEAVELDDQMCGAMASNIDGVLNGEGDVDWYMYHAVDGQACGFGDPTTNIVLLADDNVRMCAFFECDQGEPDFDCTMGAMDEDSPEGRPGCCTTGGTLNIDLNCAGSMNESADIYVRLDEAPADSCVAYNATYTWGPI